MKTINSSRTSFVQTFLAILAYLAVVAAPAEAVTPVTSLKDLNFPPLKKFTLPQPDRVVLSNGLVVFLLEDHSLPMIHAKVRVKTGSWWEPAEKHGAADLMADIMRSGGSRTTPGDQLDEILESLAASIEVSMGLTNMEASAAALRDDAPRVLGLLAEILRDPSFDQKKIDLAKLQMHDGVDRRNDSMGGILSREMTKAVYGADSPMARQLEHDHINRLTRQDLLAWHAATVSPNRMMIGLWGDFHAADMKALLEKLFGTWKVPANLRPMPDPVAAPVLQDTRVYFVDRPEAAQTNLRLGHKANRMDDPMTPALMLANEVFGSGFGSRLFKHIRTERGLAYSIGSGWGANYRLPGVFVIVGETKAETTGQILEQIQAELADFLAHGPTEEELAHAKDGMINALPFSFEDPGAVVDRVMMYELFGYPKDFLTTYIEGLKRVTLADVKQALKTYWHPDKLQWMIAGNAKKFDKPLSTFGKVETIDVTIPPASTGKKSK